MAGKVYLVGAGPGDPGLITVRGRDLIRRADVILYDALINSELLELAPEGCEKIYVGKRGGSSSITQRTINNELVRHARSGKRVVRLKGGDPYIYGRGGEEAMACEAAGVPVEIVPGVTSAIAVPAYAGIPILQRNLAGSVLFLHGRLRSPAKDSEEQSAAEETGEEATGASAPSAAAAAPDNGEQPAEERRGGVVIRRHRRREPGELSTPQQVKIEAHAEESGDALDDTGTLDVDWPSVCRAADTLVILMGMGSLDAIREGLLKGGRPADQPVAVIQWGTTPYQRTVFSSVRDFPDAVRQSGLASPAVIVVGEVVNLAGELDSYERRPLFGWRVAVLEGGEAGRELGESVFEQGGRPVLLPLASAPSLASGAEELESLCAQFHRATHILFLSGALVPLFHQAASCSGLDAAALIRHLRILGTDEDTVATLRQAGYTADLIAGEPDDAAFRATYGRRLKDSHAIVVEPEDEWSDVPDHLEEAGARITSIPIGEYVANEDEVMRLRALAERHEVQAMLVPTPWAARVLVTRGGDVLLRLIEGIVVIAGNEQVADILSAAGVTVHVTGQGELDGTALMEHVAAWRLSRRTLDTTAAATPGD